MLYPKCQGNNLKNTNYTQLYLKKYEKHHELNGKKNIY